MYKVYGPRQTPSEPGNDLPPGLPRKRIRLVHTAKPQPQGATRAARLSWTDETDTNLNVPDFLLKQSEAQDARFRPGQIGLGIIFVTAFLLSFCGVFLVSHFFQADTGSLLASLRAQTAALIFSTDPAVARAGSPSDSTDSGQASPPVEAPVPAVTEPAQPAVVEMAQADMQHAPSNADNTLVDAPAKQSMANIADLEATGTASKVALMPTMISIEPGQYIVSTVKSGNETPQLLPVDLDAFRIATTEVTRGQWQACAADSNCSMDGFPDQYFSENKLSLPVTSITTEQMMGFIEWINTKRSPGEPPFRLPLEAEWIVAARGGSSSHSEYPWGNSFDPAQIRSNDMMVPVDHSQPINGLFGMADNAAERVAGCWIMEMSDGNCYRNLGIVRGPVPGRINEQSVSLTHRTSRAKNIPYENLGFRLAQ